MVQYHAAQLILLLIKRLLVGLYNKLMLDLILVYNRFHFFASIILLELYLIKTGKFKFMELAKPIFIILCCTSLCRNIKRNHRNTIVYERPGGVLLFFVVSLILSHRFDAQ